MDVLQAPENLAPKTLLLSRQIEYKKLPMLPVNVDKFKIAPTAVQWYSCGHENLRICSCDIKFPNGKSYSVDLSQQTLFNSLINI